MHTNAIQIVRTRVAEKPFNREQQLREAVLLIFCDPVPEKCACLKHLSRREWTQLVWWLDTSGLALYFFDRLRNLDLLELLPEHIFARLQQNLEDNTERINAMIAESVSIQRRFQEADISYAVLKGFSLWPISVPKLETRSQLDLDFLIAEENALTARKILEDFGYVLKEIHGKNWDFKADSKQMPSLKTLYKAGMARSAELHLENAPGERTPLLSRAHKVCFHGVCMPVLSPVDLLLGQGLHVFQHLNLGFIRASHLIEFRRNVIAHYDDIVFWHKLRELASNQPGICLRMGAVIQFITSAMGPFAPDELTQWTVNRLPDGAMLWFKCYGRRVALMSFPGSKLHLLLRKELEAAGLPVKYSLLQSLVPRRMSPSATHVPANESLSMRIIRYRKLLLFISVRLHFHIVGGFRYFLESARWERRNEPAQ